MVKVKLSAEDVPPSWLSTVLFIVIVGLYGSQSESSKSVSPSVSLSAPSVQSPPVSVDGGFTTISTSIVSSPSCKNEAPPPVLKLLFLFASAIKVNVPPVLATVAVKINEIEPPASMPSLPVFRLASRTPGSPKSSRSHFPASSASLKDKLERPDVRVNPAGRFNLIAFISSVELAAFVNVTVNSTSESASTIVGEIVTLASRTGAPAAVTYSVVQKLAPTDQRAMEKTRARWVIFPTVLLPTLNLSYIYIYSH